MAADCSCVTAGAAGLQGAGSAASGSAAASACRQGRHRTPVYSARSRAAIRAERQRLFGERTPDGRAGQKLLRTLRAEALLPATDSAAPASPDMPISR